MNPMRAVNPVLIPESCPPPLAAADHSDDEEGDGMAVDRGAGNVGFASAEGMSSGFEARYRGKDVQLKTAPRGAGPSGAASADKSIL